MVLSRTNTRLGTMIDNSTNFTGLLGLLQDKRYTVIPKLEAYSARLEAVDFLRSIWKDECVVLPTIWKINKFFKKLFLSKKYDLY